LKGIYTLLRRFAKIGGTTTYLRILKSQSRLTMGHLIESLLP
jgi:hypothetical protein